MASASTSPSDADQNDRQDQQDIPLVLPPLTEPEQPDQASSEENIDWTLDLDFDIDWALDSNFAIDSDADRVSFLEDGDSKKRDHSVMDQKENHEDQKESEDQKEEPEKQKKKYDEDLLVFGTGDQIFPLPSVDVDLGNPFDDLLDPLLPREVDELWNFGTVDSSE